MATFEARNLGCRRGGRPVFAGLSFALAGGGALVLTGPNGSGKSSLLRLLAGLGRPAAGSIAWDGADVAEDRDAHAGRLQYLSHQDPLKPALTVAENLAFWVRLAGADAAGLDAALDAMNIRHLTDVPARYLSAGQRRRANLARVVASGAPLWLLDEPTTALDADSTGRLEAALARHLGGGGLLVLSTHTPLRLADAQTLDLAAFPAADDWHRDFAA